MEIIYLSIIILLVGIITGGIVFINTVSPAIGNRRASETIISENRRINSGNVLIGILLLIILGLFAARQIPFDMFPSANKKVTENPDTEVAKAEIFDFPPAIEKEEPKATPIKKEGIVGIFLQVGAYSTREKAEKKYERVQESIGRPYLVKCNTRRGATIYKVVIGTFASRYAAEEFGVLNSVSGFPVILTEEDNEWLR